MGVKLVFFLLFIIVLLPSSFASNKGLKLTVYLDDEIYVKTAYTSLFKIENLDHISGTTDHINLTIGYNITKNSSLVKQDTVSVKDLNSYKTSSTGSFTPESDGNYTINGWIINSTINDINQNDDFCSKTITSINTLGTPCNITLNITTDKFIYTEGEQIEFYNALNNESLPFTIEYWVEDFFNSIYKNRYNTSNTDKKTWKTSIDEQDRILLIKSKVYPLCSDINESDNFAEKMVLVFSNSTSTKETPSSVQNIEESSLEIEDADTKAKFGDAVKVKVNAYRGNTGKYSISLYIEKDSKKVSETTKIKISDKYESYNGEVYVQLVPNCNIKLENGKYDIILEGLGEDDKKKIENEGINSNLCQETLKNPDQTELASSSKKIFEYSMIDYPEKIEPNKDFEVQIKLNNNDDKDSEIDIWSYVYRGSKCYSGERTANKKHLTLKKQSSEIISLLNQVDPAESGDYKLKVLINKDSQKTNKEITQDIKIENNQEIESTSNQEESNQVSKEPAVKKETSSKQAAIADYNIINQLLCSDSVHYRQLVYESKNEKIKKLIPYFFIAAAIILIIILIIREQPKSF